MNSSGFLLCLLAEIERLRAEDAAAIGGGSSDSELVLKSAGSSEVFVSKGHTVSNCCSEPSLES